MEPLNEYLLMVYKNSNTIEKISVAAILYRYPEDCVAFFYYKNHEVYLFNYDWDTNRYTRKQDKKWQLLIDLIKELFQKMLGQVGI